MSERLTGAVDQVSRLDGEMVELSLLLPQWQVDALETAAHCRGLTAGQMLRRVINSYLSASANQR
ncbi:MAG: hypothetical protein U0746_19800 [Gemmataceae bacterium]